MEKRPALDKNIAVEDFREFYWLKTELIQFCREEGLSRQGGKVDIANRIEVYIETGKKEAPRQNQRPLPFSKFDWNNEFLTPETIISDNYKNTENVRMFFRSISDWDSSSMSNL